MELCQWHISYFYIMQLCYWHIWYFLYFMELYQGHICCFFSYVSDLLYVLYFSDKPQQEQIKSPTDGVTASSGMNYTWVEVYITFIVAKAYFICNSQSVFKKRERGWEGGIYYFWPYEIFFQLQWLRRAEGGAKMLGVFRVKNHDFTPKNLIFSNFREDPPLLYNKTVKLMIKKAWNVSHTPLGASPYHYYKSLSEKKTLP